MTTAHRPTWNSAQGGSEQGGNTLVVPSRQYSSRDLPAHQHLKSRHEGQGSTQEQDQVDFARELLLKEQELKLKKLGANQDDSPFKEPAAIDSAPYKRQKVKSNSFSLQISQLQDAKK